MSAETEKMFEQASRKKLTFDTPQGQISVEDLWDLPLETTRQNRASLEDIAVDLDRKVKAQEGTVSFVKKTVKKDTTLELQFELVKYIIDVLVAEKEAAALLKATKEKKQRYLELIEKKENEKLETMELDELKALVANM